MKGNLARLTPQWSRDASTSTVELLSLGDATPYTYPSNDNQIDSREKEKHTEESGSLRLPRVFGLPHCFGIILGSALSANVLFTVNGVQALSGGLAPALLVWFCSGAINFVGAQCYAELTAATGESGGEFIMIYRTLNPMPAFMQIWISLLAGTTMASVALAMLFSEYAIHLAFREYGHELPLHLLKLIAALQLSAVFALHCISTAWVARFQVLLTVLKFICIGVIVAAAIRFVYIGEATDLLSELQRIESVEPMDVFTAFSITTPIFLGWDRLSFVAGEVKNLKRDIPLSMSVSTIISPLLAMLLHLSFAAVLSVEEMMAPTPVIVLFAHRAMGPLAPVALLLVAIQALCSMNTGILAGTRTLYAAARESMSPEFWAMLHVRRLTFTPAALTLMLISMLMFLFDDYQKLLMVLGGLAWFPPFLVAVAVLVHRWRFPQVHRPFKVPTAFPFIFVAFCLFQTVIAFAQQPIAIVGCLIVLLPAFPLFLLLVKLRRPLTLFKAVDKATRFLQCLLLVAHDLKVR